MKSTVETNYNLELSLIIPLYNEEDNVKPLYLSIKKVVEKLQKSYEIIFIDDGSTDKTFTLLEKISREDKHIKIIKFRGNFGQSAAMAAGFEAAQGKVVISMDGDLQNDPQDIPNLLQKLDEGYDVVSGWRKNRKDKFLVRKIPSKIANKLICSVTKVKLHDTGCSLKAYRAEIIKRITLYGELHRFIPALAKIEGAKIAEIVVNHHPRKFGKSKYNLTRTFKVIMDLTTLNFLMKYLHKPLQFFGAIGILLNVLGIVTLFWIACRLLIYKFPVIQLNILITVAFLLLAGGVQFFFFGLVTDLIVETGTRKRLYLLENYRSVE